MQGHMVTTEWGQAAEGRSGKNAEVMAFPGVSSAVGIV